MACGTLDNYALPKEYEKLSKMFPKLKIVCLHGGGARWQEFGELTKSRENIYLELEGLQLHEAEGDKVPFVLNSLIKICGSSKLMFGSDWIWGDPKYLDRVNSIKALPKPNKFGFGLRVGVWFFVFPVINDGAIKNNITEIIFQIS